MTGGPADMGQPHVDFVVVKIICRRQFRKGF